MELVLRTFWVRPTVWAELQRIAAAEDRPASSLLREAVTDLIQQRNTKPLPPGSRLKRRKRQATSAK